MAVTVVYKTDGGAVRDALWTFSTDQAITTDAISENGIDLGSHNVHGVIDLGAGTPVRVKVVVKTAFAGGTSMQFQLVTSEDTGLASSVVLAETAVIVDAKLTAGKSFYINWPEGIQLDRYIGMKYVDVGAHSAGAIDCFVEGN